MAEWKKCINRISDYKIEIPSDCEPRMKVPGIIYAGPEIFADLLHDEAPAQVINVAMMPGVLEYSLAMPDIHYGYGFPIGGVAAMSVSDGVISPGGVGFDINCGVRMLRSNMPVAEIRKKADELCTSCSTRYRPASARRATSGSAAECSRTCSAKGRRGL